MQRQIDHFSHKDDAFFCLIEQSQSAQSAKADLLNRFRCEHFHSKPKGICFIDLDRTLMIKTAAPLFAKWLCQQGELSYSSLCRALILWWQHRFGVLSFELLVNGIGAIALKGRTRNELFALSEKYSKSLLSQIFNREVVAFMTHVYSTHLLVLSSRSPDFLVAAIAKTMNFDIWQASCWCSKTKMYQTIDGNDKALFFQSLIESLRLDRALCTAMSDCKDDIPLLQRAGRAIAVRPDRALRHYAMRAGWEIWDR